MKFGTLLLLAAAAVGLVWFVRRRKDEVKSLREDKPAPKVKKHKGGILDGRPMVKSLFNLATEQLGWAPAPQYDFDDTAAIYRANFAGENKYADQPTAEESPAAFSW
jgi:hypothetical protein